MRVLIGEIASGKYSEGELLPRESDVAEQFDVSRGVARECVRGLEERGLVKVRHGRGASSRPPTSGIASIPTCSGRCCVAAPGPPSSAQYLEGRRIVEVEAAGLAAERATAAAVEDLRLVFGRMRLTAEQARLSSAAEQRYHEADVAFHRAIVRAAANPVLGMMTEPIHRALAASFGALARPRARFERGLPEHERILRPSPPTIPPRRARAMRAHLFTVEGYLREYDGGRRFLTRKGTAAGACRTSEALIG